MSPEFNLLIVPINNLHGELDFQFSDCQTIDDKKLRPFSALPILHPFNNLGSNIIVQSVSNTRFSLNGLQVNKRYNINMLVFPTDK